MRVLTNTYRPAHITKATMTDGSKVFNVELLLDNIERKTLVTIAMETEKDAQALEELINKHSSWIAI